MQAAQDSFKIFDELRGQKNTTETHSRHNRRGSADMQMHRLTIPQTNTHTMYQRHIRGSLQSVMTNITFANKSKVCIFLCLPV